MDAVIAHSEHGAARLRDEVGLDPGRVRVIPHGAFDYLTRLPEEKPLPAELEGAEGPVILFFGLLRPYKGLDLLLEAFRQVEGAELWIVGNPRMDVEPLRAAAPRRRPGRVRFVTRFVEDAEIPAIFRRADLVVLPYRDAEHSGVLYTGLAFGKPMVLSAVGGFPEVAATGAARLVPPEDPAALAAALERADRRSEPPASAWPPPPARPPPAPTPGTPSPPRPSRSTRIADASGAPLRRHKAHRKPMIAVLAAIFWLSAAPDRLHAPRLSARAAPARRACAGRRKPPAEPAELPRVSLIVAAYDEEEVIEAKVANALALDYPRERLELIVASDGSADAHRRARPRRRRRPRPRAAPRRQARRPERRRRAGLRRDPRLLRRQQRLAPRRPAPPRRALRRPGGRLRLRPGPLPRRRRRQPRGRLLALRDGGARDGVLAGRGHRRQRRDLRRARATAYMPLPPSGSHDLSFPFALAKRGKRSLYVPGARAEEKMVPTLEGEFARKRRMMVGLWDIVVGEGMISPARLLRRSTPSSSSRIACCAT